MLSAYSDPTLLALSFALWTDLFSHLMIFTDFDIILFAKICLLSQDGHVNCTIFKGFNQVITDIQQNKLQPDFGSLWGPNRLLTAQLSLLSSLWGTMKDKASREPSHSRGVSEVFLQLVSTMKKWVGTRTSELPRYLKYKKPNPPNHTCTKIKLQHSAIFNFINSPILSKENLGLKGKFQTTIFENQVWLVD